MNKQIKKLLGLVLCFSLLLGTVGCMDVSKYIPGATADDSGNSISSSISVSSDKVTADSPNEEFDAFLNDLFIEEVSSDTITLHYTLKDPSVYGLDDAEVTWGDFDIDTFDENSQEVQDYYDELTAFDYDTLDKDQQQIYDIIEQDLALELKYDGYEYYSDVFSGTSSLQSNIPITMAEYQFYVESDITNYIELLNQLPDYVDKICEFETAKSEKGLFMSDTAADEAIKQCEDFIADTESNVLIETFNTRIDAFEDLSDSEKTAYKEANQKAVEESVIPAYQKIIDNITSLKGTGTNEGGLCNFENGDKYYEYLVANNTGSTRSVDKFATMIDDSIKNAMTDIYSVYSENEDAYNYYYDNDLDYGSNDPVTILDTLKVSMLDYYPEPADTSYSVKYVHKSLEDTVSPAFYMVPPIDDSVENVIYINQGEKNGSSNLFTTLAHEGYPGHLYQTTYFNATNPNPIRSMFSFGGYDEGWATYVELNSYDLVEFPEYDEELSKLSKAMDIISLAISTRIDIGVNYEGWSVEEVSSYLSDSGFNGDAAQDIYDYVVQDPGNYLKYYCGYLEFDNLRNYAKSELGSDFDIKEFNKALLDAGSCQFNIVKTYVDDYIDHNK